MRPSVLLPALLFASSALLAGRAEAGTLSRGDVAPVLLGESGGKPVLLSDYRGKVVVITFWKKACKPCMDQMQAFEDLNKQYASQGLQVIGVDAGDSSREYGSLLRHVKRPTMVMAHDEGPSVGEAWGVYMLPSVWVVDADGRIAAHHEGYVGADLPGIFAEIAGILAANQPAAATPAPAPAPAGGTPR